MSAKKQKTATEQLEAHREEERETSHGSRLMQRERDQRDAEIRRLRDEDLVNAYARDDEKAAAEIVERIAKAQADLANFEPRVKGAERRAASAKVATQAFVTSNLDALVAELDDRWQQVAKRMESGLAEAIQADADRREIEAASNYYLRLSGRLASQDGPADTQEFSRLLSTVADAVANVPSPLPRAAARRMGTVTSDEQQEFAGVEVFG